VDHLRERVARFAASSGLSLDLAPHDHAFGSGGDFRKTGHATTGACILAAPAVPICKTGTTNVTAEHGSSHVARQLGVLETVPCASRLNRQLASFGFAFVPLPSLGVPYSDALRAARRRLWRDASDALQAATTGPSGWQDVVRTTDVPLDVFKVVSPNAQVLGPEHHTTGVCHLGMLPYVLGIYLHLGTTGLVVHCYDGVDELSNASSDPRPGAPNNLVVRMGRDQVTIAEVGPEDLGLRRCALDDIAEQPDVRDDAASFLRVLAGAETGPRRDFLVANAALLLVAAERTGAGGGDLAGDLWAGVRASEELIDSGAAHRNYRRLLQAQA
jgi:anthranilate phosphoribosyltransferase